MSDTLRYCIESVNLFCLVVFLFISILIWRNEVWRGRVVAILCCIGERLPKRLLVYLPKVHGFWHLVTALSIPRLIYLLIYFPGNIDSDCSYCIQDFFAAYTHYAEVIGPGVVSNHHPLLHTLLYGGFMYLGDCVGSQNVGVFCFILLQVLLINAGLALLCRKTYETGWVRWANALVLFYALMPIYSLWSIEMAKDQLYAGCLVWYVWQLWNIVESKGLYLCGVWTMLLHVIILFLVCAMKNQGVYIVLICGVALLLFYGRQVLRIIPPYLLSVFCYLYLYQNLLFAALDVRPAGRQEAMGFMFQQTARYAKYHPEEISALEREAIDRVIPFDLLAQRYNPIYQDDVKFCSREFAGEQVSEEDYRQYCSIWLRMALRHPETYLMSMMHNCYGFFYPVHIYERMFHHSKDPLGPCVAHPEVFRYKQLTCTYFLQRGIKYAMPVLSALPVVGLFFGFPLYTWILFLSSLYLFTRKKIRYLVVLLPALLSVAVLFVSPANEVYRYIEPVVFLAPFAMVWSILTVRTDLDRDKSFL